MTTTPRSAGFWRRSLDAFIAARERQATTIVARALLRLDDSTLTSHGYNRRELERRVRSTL